MYLNLYFVLDFPNHKHFSGLCTMASKTQENLPFITGYPSLSVKKDIQSTGKDLYDNLVKTWIVLLKFYSNHLVTSLSLRNFLESYLQESAQLLLPDPDSSNDTSSSIANNHLNAFFDRINNLDESDKSLRAAVFSLIVSHPDNDSKSLPFLDSLSYPYLYIFIKLYGPTNISTVKKCIDTLYSTRGGKPFVNLLTASALATPLTPIDASVIGNVILPSSSLLAKDWVTVKWFFSLENLYTLPDTSSYTRQSIIDTSAASFLVSISILDSNTKIRVINDIISRIGSSSQHNLMSALLNFTNFSGLIGVPSLTVTLETAKLRLPKVPFPGDGTKPKLNKSKDKKGKQSETDRTYTANEKQQIETVRELFPQLSETAVYGLLQQHNSAELVTSYLLENMDELDRLASQLDADLTVSKSDTKTKKSTQPTSIPTGPSSAGPSKSKQRSIYENDELSTLNISRGQISFGKKEFKVGKASKKTLETTLELIYNAEEDEHDDTYDDAEMGKPTDKKGKPVSIDDNEVSGNGLDGGDSKIPSAPREAEAGPASPADRIEQYLWEHFERSPNEFLRAARRTRVRKEMVDSTGWSHEQIEGWARMIERSPKRKEILAEKYMFKGNTLTIKPTAFRQRNKKWESDEDDDADNAGDVGEGESSKIGMANSNQPRPKNNGNSGNTGNGNNQHRNKESNKPEISSAEKAKRDQKRKEKNKARHGNHNRKAGHDKKMAKAGALS